MTLGLFDVAFVGALPRYDADAQDYINRVIAADVAAGNNSGLESGVQDAYNAFFVACKSDGMLNAIKACCIMAGARTLQGCLVPLVGAAPTRFGTEGGWNYDRKTGLRGNGTNNYLNSNRNNNADPQDSRHVSVFMSELAGNDNVVIIGTSNILGRTSILRQVAYSARISSNAFPGSITGVPGFLGGVRSSPSQSSIHNGGVTTTFSVVSQVPASENMGVFANGLGGTPAATRIAFYSIGESLDLALLDARVTALTNAIAAAIP